MLTLKRLRELTSDDLVFFLNEEGTYSAYHKGRLITFDQTEVGLQKSIEKEKEIFVSIFDLTIGKRMKNLVDYEFTNEDVEKLNALYTESELEVANNYLAMKDYLGFKDELASSNLEEIYNKETKEEILESLSNYLPYMNISDNFKVNIVYFDDFNNSGNYGEAIIDIFNYQTFKEDITNANEYVRLALEDKKGDPFLVFNKKLDLYYPTLYIANDIYFRKYVKVRG